MISDSLVVDRGVTAQDSWITVQAANAHEALAALKDDGFRLLLFLTCVDHLADPSRPSAGGSPGEPGPTGAKGGVPPGQSDRYEIVYQLRNLETREQVRVRVFVDGDPPHVDSVSDLFPPANWDERETYDLFGIVFDNHPDLSRILMPDDWVGHPLRRDYPVGGEVVEFSEEHAQWQTAPEKA